MVATYIMATHADAPIQYLFCEPVQGGHGAFPGKDGGCMAFVGDGDVSNTPVEVLEQRFPITCQRFELEPEAGGSGQWRGGSGVVREFWVQSEASMIKTAQENSKDTTSRGVAGGGDGRATYVELHYPDGQVERCDERLGDTPVPVGLLISTHTGGGGGYGKPVDRDPQKVAEDVRDGYLTLEEAKSVYKVALSQGALPECWEVDTGATSRLRAA
jgi:N-methylhydantoinase B